MTTAPQIDARHLAALRKRTFTGARKAAAVLAEEVAADQAALEAGEVPPGSAVVLRKTFEKYAHLLATLDIADSLLSPEALEAMNEEDAPEPGTAVVNQEDLALLTNVVRSFVPPGPEDRGDTPLGRLTRAAYPGGLGPSELAELAAVPAGPSRVPAGPVPPATAPDGEHDPGCPPMSSEDV